MFEFLKSKLSKNKEEKSRILEIIENKVSITKNIFNKKFGSIFYKKDSINEDIMEELEKIMIKADISIDIIEEILLNLEDQYKAEQIKDSDDLVNALEMHIPNLLKKKYAEIDYKKRGKPFIFLICGVNGVGKTSLIIKLANYLKRRRLSVMLAAGDTFRAGAISQLKLLAKQIDVDVISQEPGSDSASVIFDACLSAKKNEVDILLVDTAGRIHTKNNLMKELEKIIRVLKKISPEAPHETMMVLDANIGQNSLKQVQEFSKTVNIDSVSITKLDGTAKGGVVLSILNKMKKPIRFISIGEKVNDIRKFNPNEFLKILIN